MDIKTVQNLYGVRVCLRHCHIPISERERVQWYYARGVWCKNEVAFCEICKREITATLEAVEKYLAEGEE